MVQSYFALKETVSEYRINCNGKHYIVNVCPDKPLLWVLREDLGLYGTKYGCGIGICV
jgi:isoquinoline 1-oxidoreductase alpha subunit